MNIKKIGTKYFGIIGSLVLLSRKILDSNERFWKKTRVNLKNEVVKQLAHCKSEKWKNIPIKKLWCV
ncbi:hypothetical protein Aaphi23p32b [Haemophilus phage Aaphi23]|uniref:hypothetical protein n=1 Tax=Haemophilus phage Aaphi23 TaxID=230158 RepID=UPI00003502A1|nr:hypothetical protein Aaphi23p32b [Haemophilus phage Aaphi23]CAG18453.1 hypothetical protein [Haemophilus phage Aaphi23]